MLFAYGRCTVNLPRPESIEYGATLTCRASQSASDAIKRPKPETSCFTLAIFRACQI